MKTPIFIPYETKNREFDGKLLLISHLLNDFELFFIGSRKGIKREALRHKNGIYILKSLSLQEEFFYRALKQRGFRIVLLHTEGGIFYKDNTESLRSAFNESLLKYVDINFLFGDEVLIGLNKQSGSGKTKCIVSGEPRFDLLKPKYRKFFNSELKELENRYGDFFLVNTNFGCGNSFVGEEKFLEYLKFEKTITKKEKELLYQRIPLDKKLTAYYTSALLNLARKFPKLNFIIRPHPSEDTIYYENEFSEKKNIHVVKKGNVVKWILASKGVIHYDCTTGMEASLADVPVLSYTPELVEAIIAWLPMVLSKKCETEDVLNKVVNDIVEDKFYFTISSEIFENWKKNILNVDIEASPIIQRELREQAGEMPAAQNYLSVFLIYERLRTHLKSYYDKMLGRKSITREKFGLIDKREISEKLNSLMQINGFEAKFHLSCLGDDTVKIKKIYER